MSNSTNPNSESLTEQIMEAGGSAAFIEYAETFPESIAAQHVEMCLEYRGGYVSGGSFCDALWNGDVELAYRRADNENRRRLEHLFPGYTSTLNRAVA